MRKLFAENHGEKKICLSSMNHENSSPELSASKQTHRISVQISISVIKKKTFLPSNNI